MTHGRAFESILAPTKTNAIIKVAQRETKSSTKRLTCKRLKTIYKSCTYLNRLVEGNRRAELITKGKRAQNGREQT